MRWDSPYLTVARYRYRWAILARCRGLVELSLNWAKVRRTDYLYAHVEAKARHSDYIMILANNKSRLSDEWSRLDERERDRERERESLANSAHSTEIWIKLIWRKLRRRLLSGGWTGSPAEHLLSSITGQVILQANGKQDYNSSYAAHFDHLNNDLRSREQNICR